MVMGGLRPGGGEEWNTSFKNFLKHHWQEVQQKSGQPFDLSLFEKEHFNYDTEPACRAAVTARTIAPEKALAFYELIQHHFYVETQDPKQPEFYKPICKTLDIDYNKFLAAFTSEAMKEATRADFTKSRQLGVRGFPTVMYRKKDKRHVIASGYTDFESLKRTLVTLRKKNS